MPFEVCTCSGLVFVSFSSHNFKNVIVATQSISPVPTWALGCEKNVSTLVMSIAKILDWAADNFVYFRKVEKLDS